MKIDLHVHTAERSSCGSSHETAQIRAAIRAGLDAIVFTDHDTLTPSHRLEELNNQYAPFKIFGGIEVSIWDSNLAIFEHFLVLGIHDPVLETYPWTYPELLEFVRERQGFIAVAHLYRYRTTTNLDLARFTPDALEVASSNIPREPHQRLISLVDDLGIPALGNSDAHHVKMIGKHYNELFKTPSDEAELIAMLQAGDFRPYWPEYDSFGD